MIDVAESDALRDVIAAAQALMNMNPSERLAARSFLPIGEDVAANFAAIREDNVHAAARALCQAIAMDKAIRR
jgi:hypothetical protein